MRLVYALILCAGFDLRWSWYLLAIVMWTASSMWTHGELVLRALIHQSPETERDKEAGA